MITDAIAVMKERNGSSQVAIRKFVEEKYGKRLPSNFRKNLILHLKRLVASGKLVKLKKSFKVPSGVRSLPKSSTRSKSRTRKDTKVKAGTVRKKAKSPMAKKNKKNKKEIKTVA